MTSGKVAPSLARAHPCPSPIRGERLFRRRESAPSARRYRSNAMAEPEDLERGGAFYGRRKGKRLRAGQENLVETLLPKLRVDPDRDPRAAFGQPVQNLW